MQHAVFVQAEFKFGIGNDDAFARGVIGSTLIQSETHVTNLLGQFRTDALFHLIKADVFVVLAHIGFRSGREQRLRQLFGQLQTGGQLDAADFAGSLIVFPTRTDDVTAHNRFNQNRFEAFDHDRATAHLLDLIRRDHGARINAGQMIRHHVVQLREPKIAHLIEHFAFVRNRFVHHHIKRGQAIGGNHQ